VQDRTPSVDIFEIEVYKSVEEVVGRKRIICSELSRIRLYIETRRFEWWLIGTIELRCLPGLHRLIMIIVLLLNALLEDISVD